MVKVYPLTMSEILVFNRTQSKELENSTMTGTTKSVDLFSGLVIDIRAKSMVMMYLVVASII